MSGLQIVIELKDDNTRPADWFAAGDVLRALYREHNPGRVHYRIVDYEESRNRADSGTLEA